MQQISFEEAIARIRQKDRRYHEDAYAFLRESLSFTVKQMGKPVAGPGRHVSGQELLEGVRQYALSEYGAMAFRVLARWGVHRTEDVGEIVFNLVDMGALGKTDRDTRADFEGVYDFDEAFRSPFRVPEPPAGRSPAKRPRTPESAAGAAGGHD
jgi:uncharacterized repeat protein (TIGR04138 family)